jgi:hypothetical protein
VFKNWSNTFTADSTTDVITLNANLSNLQTGDKVQLTTTGTLPNGLALATDYYIVKISDSTVKLATGQGSAYLEQTINFTDNGTGIHTVTCLSLAVYQNGLKVNSDNVTTFTGSWVEPTGEFVIGANRTYNGDFYIGHMSKLRIWSRGLTELEAWENYTGKIPDGSVNYLTDGINDLTFVGSPTWNNPSIRANIERANENRSTTVRSTRV